MSELTIEIKKRIDEEEKKRILEINESNLVINGGQLHYKGILQHDFVVLVKCQQVVVGYALLKETFLAKDDIYVMQVAVDNDFKHLGIGTKIYDYTYNYLKGYKYFTANVNPDNIISQDFHNKCGFKLIGENNLGFVYVKNVEKNVKLELSDAKKESFKINKSEIKQYDECQEMKYTEKTL